MTARRLAVAALSLWACSSNPIDYAVAISPAAATVTAGRTVQLGATSNGDVAFSVQEPGGGSVTSSGAYTAPSTPGTYHVVATSLKDAKKSATATLTVVAAAQTPVIHPGSAALTVGKSGTAAVDPQAGATFDWTINGGTLAGPATGASVSFTSGTPGAVVLGVTATNAAGDRSAPGFASVAIVALPQKPVIDAPLAVTTGRAGLTASVPAEAGVTVSWTIGNGSITAGANSTTIAFIAGIPGKLDLTATAINAAGDPAVATISIDVHPVGLEHIAGGLGGPGNADGVGNDARFALPWGVAEDPSGNLLVTDVNNHDVRRVAPDGTVTRIAGAGFAGYSESASGGITMFNSPMGILSDPSGNAVVADYGNLRIRVVQPDGGTFTIAGTGSYGTTDGDPLTQATFSGPAPLALSATGDVWTFDLGTNTIRLLGADAGVPWVGSFAAGAVAGASGLAQDPTALLLATQCQVTAYDGGAVWTIAGGTCGAAVDGVGSAAQFSGVIGIARNPISGAVYVTDPSNHAIRRMDYDAGSTEWSVSTAVSSTSDAGQVDGPVGTAVLMAPYGITVRGDGGVAFTDQQAIRQLGGGDVTTLAGKAAQSGNVDGLGLSARFESPAGVAVDGRNNAYVSEARFIRRVAADGTVTTFAGVDSLGIPRDGLAGTAVFGSAEGLAWDAKHAILYVADKSANTIRAVTHEPDFGADVVTTVAGRYNGGNCSGIDSSDALDAGLCSPVGVAVDSEGRVYFTEGSAGFNGQQAVRVIERYPDGGGFSLGTVASGAGFNCTAFGPAQGPLPGAAFGGFCRPSGIAIDAHDRIFVADTGSNRIVEIEQDGGVWVVNGVVGDGNFNCLYSDGAGTDAGLCAPQALAVDTSGTLWVGDTGNATVRKVTFDSTAGAWTATTVAGTFGVTGVKTGALKPGPARVNRVTAMAPTPYGDIAVVDQAENSLLLLRPP